MMLHFSHLYILPIANSWEHSGQKFIDSVCAYKRKHLWHFKSIQNHGMV